MLQLRQLLTESYIPGIEDYEIIAATLVGEAGGEGQNGMIAIRNVLDNRSVNRSTSAAGEALRPRQFSMWDSATSGVNTKSDYNVKKILTVINKFKNHSSWKTATSLAKKKLSDITGDATHYYAFQGPNRIAPPSWTKKWKHTADIGNHKFGYLV